MNQSILDIEHILAEVVEIADPAQRRAYMDQACAGDAALRAQVERLLGNYDRAGSFLEEPAAVSANAPLPIWGETLGNCIGPYKLLELIGEGGMGVVYLAEQQEPVRREVALKVIKPGMDSQQVVARFEAERQALAIMDHPNIARVLDAGTFGSEQWAVGSEQWQLAREEKSGTKEHQNAAPSLPTAHCPLPTAGRPYFVMELVRGIPITEYCDQAQMDVRQRLEVFIQVCRAVQHAHTKGIIHRDLKPGNVLVTSHDGIPEPKVIDFGVAKALEQPLTERTLHTGFAQLIGTPLYMSPEQAEFNLLGVDTRSDIYSLGVMLYELLTGSTPFALERLRLADFDEMRRILREEEPPRPSKRLSTLGAALSTVSQRRGVDPRKLSQLMHGELDWIVLKALEKDRTRRYESASALAADLQRYLNDEPVEACPPSRWYRLRKIVRRNRRAMTTVGIIAAALVAATAVSTWQAVEANAARRLADERLDNEKKAQKEAATDAAVARAVNDFLMQDLLLQVDTNLQIDEGNAAVPDLTMKIALGRAAARISQRFQDMPLVEAAIRLTIGRSYLGLGENDLAVPHLERAMALRKSQLVEHHPSTLESMGILADAWAAAGRRADGIALRKRILVIQMTQLGADHPATLRSVGDLAAAYRADGQWDLSVSLFEELLEKQRAVCGSAHPNTINTMHQLAMTYTQSGRFKEAVALHELVQDINVTNGRQHVSPFFLITFASACQGAGKLEKADHLLREALEYSRKREGPVALLGTAATLGWLAQNLLLQENYTVAEEAGREALAIFEKERPDDARRFYVASTLGAILLGKNEFHEAEHLLLQGYEGMKAREALHAANWLTRMVETGQRVVRFYEVTEQPGKVREWREKLAVEKSPR